MVYFDKKTETIALGGGCFWCIEAIFKRIKGVQAVIPGYSGGKLENPSYEDVKTGTTGYVEVIQIEFDPTVITLDKLLEVFFIFHDPTTINRQGADVGTQYRSVIFYCTEKQKTTAEEAKKRIEESQIYKDRIVTEVLPYKTFYKAENYHVNYFEKNKNSFYCRVVINPKIQKLVSEFKSLTK